MKSLYRSRPVVVLALSLYAGHCLVVLAGLFWLEPLLVPAAFVWPYPFLLALQRVIPNSAGALKWLAALGFGFVLIGTVATWVERRLRPGGRLITLAPALGVLAVVLPLAGVTACGYATAIAFGWPYGE